MIFTLRELGWSNYFQDEFNKIKNNSIAVGRISNQQKNLYRVRGEFGEVPATVAGKFRFETVDKGDFPVVGDWVTLGFVDGAKQAVIQNVLPRKTKISRKVAGNRSDEQVISANIDLVFIVTSLNQNFNIHRLERFLTVVRDGGAEAVFILTKADLATDIDSYITQVSRKFGNIVTIPISAVSGLNIDTVEKLIDGKTVAFIGSSGVGKSTLINRLVGEEKAKIQEISFGDRGKHTTTSREFILFKNSILIDNPGIKELQFVGNEEFEDSTGDIAFYAVQCKFNDCKHDSEPGCAVRKAIEDGELDMDVLTHRKKLEKEINDARKRTRGSRRRF